MEYLLKGVIELAVNSSEIEKDLLNFIPETVGKGDQKKEVANWGWGMR
jgi:hypothetical protein